MAKHFRLRQLDCRRFGEPPSPRRIAARRPRPWLDAQHEYFQPLAANQRGTSLPRIGPADFGCSRMQPASSRRPRLLKRRLGERLGDDVEADRDLDDAAVGDDRELTEIRLRRRQALGVDDGVTFWARGVFTAWFAPPSSLSQSPPSVTLTVLATRRCLDWRSRTGLVVARRIELTERATRMDVDARRRRPCHRQ